MLKSVFEDQTEKRSFTTAEKTVGTMTTGSVRICPMKSVRRKTCVTGHTNGGLGRRSRKVEPADSLQTHKCVTQHWCRNTQILHWLCKSHGGWNKGRRELRSGVTNKSSKVLHRHVGVQEGHTFLMVELRRACCGSHHRNEKKEGGVCSKARLHCVLRAHRSAVCV